MTNYVAGFLFDPSAELVALIRKNKPAWQQGKFNGIGGKIEPNETPYRAMVREFAEETGATISEWQRFCFLHCEDATVTFFKAQGDLMTLRTLRSATDETVSIVPVSQIQYLPVIPNLKWLIPMALDNASAQVWV